MAMSQETIVDIDTGFTTTTNLDDLSPNVSAASTRTDFEVQKIARVSSPDGMIFDAYDGNTPYGTPALSPISESTIFLQMQQTPPVAELVSPLPRLFMPMMPTRHEDLAVRRIRSMTQKYNFQKQIGSGGYGVVWQAVQVESGQTHAVKSVTHAHRETQQCYDKELLFAWKVHHPSIVTLVETFQDDERLHFVMEICTGGSLDARIKARSYINGMAVGPRGLPQSLLPRYIWEMLSGIGYLHHHRIAHRDCKPGNYMLADPSDDAPLKLIDFGLAVRFQKGVKLTERVGTPGFAAPEVGAGSYTEKCDIWSVGIVSFLCCVGSPPFDGETALEVMMAVRDKPVQFSKMEWDLVRPQMKAIVQSMLVKDPVARRSAKELADANEKMLTKAKEDVERRAAGHPSCCTIA
jgi:serine/threonine protein kinase